MHANTFIRAGLVAALLLTSTPTRANTTSPAATPRLAVLEYGYASPSCPVCADQADAAYAAAALSFAANPQVLLVRYNLDSTRNGGLRSERWDDAWGAASATAPKVMADSGQQLVDGTVATTTAGFAAKFKGMLDTALPRPPKAALTTEITRIGTTVHFDVIVKNTSGGALSLAQDVSLHGLVYEDDGVDKRYVFKTVSVSAGSLANGASMRVQFDTDPVRGIDWNRMRTLVIADYRPDPNVARYDTLQAVSVFDNSMLSGLALAASADIAEAGQGVLLTAAAEPFVATTPITYVWSIQDQPVFTRTGGLSDTQTAAWTTPGPKRVEVRALNASGEVTAQRSVTVTAQSLTSLSAAGPATAYVNTRYPAVFSVAPVSATLPVSYVWGAGSAAGAAVYTATLSWPITGAMTTSVSAQNPAGGVVSASFGTNVIDVPPVVLSGTLGAQLVYSDGFGAATVISAPMGVISAAAWLRLTPLLTVTEPPTGTAFAQHAYRLELAPMAEVTIPVSLTLGMPVSISQDFTVADVAGQFSSTLRLVQRGPAAWHEAGSDCAPGPVAQELDLVRGRISAAACGLGEFALLSTAWRVYLPLAGR